MKITTDWHIHSHNSCDCRGRGMTMRQIIEGAAAVGITDFGVAEHLHSRVNMPDIVASRDEFVASSPPARFHFGLEATCMRQWELDEIAAGGHEDAEWGIPDRGPGGGPFAIDLGERDVLALGIEYVIGVVHWSRGVAMQREAIIDDYLGQYLFLAGHPLVDIIGHPWWWNGAFEDPPRRYMTKPWFDDFAVIPQSVHDEFIAALLENGKAAEINPGVLMTDYYPEPWRMQYLEYLGELARRGVKLAAGSDRHLRPYENGFEAMAALLEKVGIRDEDLWRLPPRPLE